MSTRTKLSFKQKYFKKYTKKKEQKKTNFCLPLFKIILLIV